MSSLYINTGIITMLWSITPIIYKILLVEFSAPIIMILTSMAYAVCTLGYAIINRVELRQAISRISYRNLGLVVISGVFAGFFANRLYYITMKHHSAHLVTALTALYPAITVILAYFVLSEKIKFMSAAGILLICIGLGMIGYADYNVEKLTVNKVD
jgi:uncharacterized membrane protein